MFRLLFLLPLWFPTLLFAQQSGKHLNRYKKGLRQGKWVVYHDEEKKIPESSGRYRKGWQRGKWFYYYPDGKLEHREVYRFGKIKMKYYYPGGQVRKMGMAKWEENDIRMHYYYYGAWKHFKETGELEKIEYYERGEKKSTQLVLPPAKGQQNDSLIKVLFALDQQFKKSQDTLVAAYGSYGSKSTQYAFAKRWARENDSLVFLQVDDIIGKFGYPNREQVGEQAGVLFFIISAAPQPLREKHYSLILKARDNGILTAKDVAFFVDKVMVGKGEKQIYGTLFKFDHKNNRELYYPIGDPAEVNKKRKEVGLEEVDWGKETFLK